MAVLANPFWREDIWDLTLAWYAFLPIAIVGTLLVTGWKVLREWWHDRRRQRRER
jgi:hypothetical protein